MSTLSTSKPRHPKKRSTASKQSQDPMTKHNTAPELDAALAELKALPLIVLR